MIKIRVEKTVITSINNETVLESLERNNYKIIQIGCRNGGCGICKVQVISGEYRRLKMSNKYINQEDIKNNIVLACCIIPITDINIKLI